MLRGSRDEMIEGLFQSMSTKLLESKKIEGVRGTRGGAATPE